MSELKTDTVYVFIRDYRAFFTFTWVDHDGNYDPDWVPDRDAAKPASAYRLRVIAGMGTPYYERLHLPVPLQWAGRPSDLLICADWLEAQGYVYG